MALKDIFSRRRGPLDEAAGEHSQDGPSPVASDLDGNEAVHKKQRLLLSGAVGAAALIGCAWVLGGGDDGRQVAPGKPEQVKVSVGDMANRTLSEQEWMALSENRFQSAENQLKGVDGTNAKVAQLSQEIDALRAQNSSMSSDGQRVMSAYQAENEQLRRQINDRAAAPPVPPGPQALYGPASAAVYGRPASPASPASPEPAAVRLSEVKMVSFGSTERGTASRIAKGSTVYTDSPNYLPANSFATAKVVVGVDAAAGVNSQTDPLPVVLRITGPARSVLQNGRRRR